MTYRMENVIERIILALVIALILAGVTIIVASAQGETPQPGTAPAAPVTYDNCVTCHEETVTSWQTGLHAQAYTDTVFMNVWNTQGKPAACLTCHTTGYDAVAGTFKSEGVGCESCHSPIPGNHPVDNMPVDKSPDQCGKCHSDPRFSADQWKLSSHYQQNMNCTVCHDQHTAGMKILEGTGPISDASALCANCHKNVMDNFPTSVHAAAGVTCVGCHLTSGSAAAETPADFVSAHRAPDHSFIPSVKTCNKCHSNQMHTPGDAAVEAAIQGEPVTHESAEADAPESGVEASATLSETLLPESSNAVIPVAEPAPVSPLGFAGMAGLLGLAGGMVLAPWLERAYRLFAKGDKND